MQADIFADLHFAESHFDVQRVDMYCNVVDHVASHGIQRVQSMCVKCIEVGTNVCASVKRGKTLLHTHVIKHQY